MAQAHEKKLAHEEAGRSFRTAETLAQTSRSKQDEQTKKLAAEREELKSEQAEHRKVLDTLREELHSARQGRNEALTRASGLGAQLRKLQLDWQKANTLLAKANAALTQQTEAGAASSAALQHQKQLCVALQQRLRQLKKQTPAQPAPTSANGSTHDCKLNRIAQL